MGKNKENQKKIKRTRRLKIGSMSQKLLLRIGEMMEGGLDVLDLMLTPFPDFYKKAYYGSSWRIDHSSLKRVQISYRELQKREYIREEIQNKNKRIIITSRGKVEILRSKIFQKKKEKWDGKWRIVIFDISEKQRRGRNLIRRELRWLGFKELQKSVWIFPYDIELELKDLIDILTKELKGDIRFLTVEKMNYDQDFKIFFKLSYLGDA